MNGNILLRLYHFLRGPRRSPIEDFTEAGNMVVGSRSDVSGLFVEIMHQERNCQNIKIGNDCILKGSLSIYSPNAKIVIGDRVFIGPESKLISRECISVGDDVMISWDCTIMDTNSHSLNSEERANDVLEWAKGFESKKWDSVETKPIVICKKSWIGFKSIVLKGVMLGEGTVVASGSVVTKSFPQFSIVGGNPARFIKKSK